MPFLPVLDAGAAAGSVQFFPMLSILLIFVIFYFLMIRPQNKKQKETEKMIAALKKGDKVITIGGIHGVVSSTKEKTVIVKVDDNTKIEFNRTAIASVEVEEKEAKAKDKKEKIEAKKDSEVEESSEEKK